MWEFFYLFFKHTNQIEQIVNDVNYKKRQRINELKDINSHLYKRFYERPFIDLGILGISENLLVKDAINKNNTEIAKLESEIAEDRYNQSKGDSKMDNKEELKRSLAEEEQRAKDSLANVEKMKKQLEELNKKDEQPTVSATGVLLEEPQKNSTFFANHGDNSTQTENYNFESYEKGCFNVNNVFSTKEQARQEALRRKIQELIRRRAMEWNSNHDWRKDNKERYEIAYNFDKNKIDVSSLNDYCSYGNIVFDTKELAQQMIDELNKNFNTDELKIGFGVI